MKQMLKGHYILYTQFIPLFTDDDDIVTVGEGVNSNNHSPNSTLRASSSQSGGDSTLHASQHSSVNSSHREDPPHRVVDGQGAVLEAAVIAQLEQDAEEDRRAERLVDLMVSLEGDLQEPVSGAEFDAHSKDTARKAVLGLGIDELSTECARAVLEWSDHESGSEPTTSDPVQPLSSPPTPHLVDLSSIDDAYSQTYRELQHSNTPQLPVRLVKILPHSQTSVSPSNNNTNNCQDSLGFVKSSPRSIKRHISAMKTAVMPPSPGLDILDMDDDLLKSLTMPEGSDTEILNSLPPTAGRLNFDTDSDESKKSPSHAMFASKLSKSESVKPFSLQMDNDYVNSEEEELLELANTSARIIEIQNGNYTESIEISPNKRKPVNADSEFLSSPAKCTTSHKTVVSSTLQALDNDTEDLIARYHRLRKEAVRVTEGISTSNKVGASINVLKEEMFTQKRKDESQNNVNLLGQESIVNTSGGRPTSPLISEKYLQHTPVKKTTLESRFTLNLDSDDETTDPIVPSSVKLTNLTPLRTKPAADKQTVISPSLVDDLLSLEDLTADDLVALTPTYSPITTPKKRFVLGINSFLIQILLASIYYVTNFVLLKLFCGQSKKRISFHNL